MNNMLSMTTFPLVAPMAMLALIACVLENLSLRRAKALARTGLPEEEADGTHGDELVAKLDALLPQVKADEAARQEYLDVLELLGPQDPRTVEYRRALSRQLF